MSRWLQSVGNILDKLDDGAETAVDESRQVAQRFLTTRQTNESDDDDHYYDDYEGSSSDDEDEVLESGIETNSEYESYGERDEAGGDSTTATASSVHNLSSSSAWNQDETDNSAPMFANDISERFETPNQIPRTETKAKTAAALPFQSPPAAVASTPTRRLNQDDRVEKVHSASSRTGNATSAMPAGMATPAATSSEGSNPTTTVPAPLEPIVSKASGQPATVAVKPRSPMAPPPPRPPSSAPPHPNTTTVSGTLASSQHGTGNAKRSSAREPSSKRMVEYSMVQKLERTNAQLRAELEAANAELRAQQDELLRVGEEIAEERQNLREERNELLDEQESEIEILGKEHLEELSQQKQRYEARLKELQTQLRQEQQERAQEGGDYTEELQDGLEREKTALQQIQQEQEKSMALQSQLAKLQSQQESLQGQVASLNETTQTARDRERLAEERLDEANAQHKHQLLQRQAREAELERTVTELGAALTMAQQQNGSSSRQLASNETSPHGDTGEATSEGIEYKEKYQLVAEELDSVQTQMRLVTQRCESLQSELKDVVDERAQEAAAGQSRQRQYDAQVGDLTTQVKRLQAELREWKRENGVAVDSPSSSAVNRSETSAIGEDPSSTDIRLLQALKESEEAKKQVASLSDQLIRQQNLVESSKSEVLALKGRLQAASARADSAESSLAASSGPSSLDIEGGGLYSGGKMRRRVKGGLRAAGGRTGSLGPRSVRNALGLRATSGSAMEQVAITVDAVDKWMLDTGTILRHEPLARVVFAIYLIILHLWCFALVFFHAVESEHGDLDAMRQGNHAAFHPGPATVVERE